MLRSTAAVFLCLLFLADTACYTARVVSPAPKGIKRQSEDGVILFWGMWSSTTRADECRNGLSEVSTTTPWYGYIVAPVTVFIAHPVRKSYTCAVSEGF